jgi:hypothetical protein
MFGAATPGFAQQSASFRLSESALNAGGRPEQGLIATSASYRMTLDAIGDTVAGAALVSLSFSMSPGLVSAYPPPGEVVNVRLSDPTTLAWDPEKSAGVYNLYRGTVGSLPGTYGSCYQLSLTSNTTTDTISPPPSQIWFYLVTVENGLWEEGTKGYASNGAQRGNPTPCP